MTAISEVPQFCSAETTSRRSIAESLPWQSPGNSGPVGGATPPNSALNVDEQRQGRPRSGGQHGDGGDLDAVGAAVGGAGGSHDEEGSKFLAAAAGYLVPEPEQ